MKAEMTDKNIGELVYQWRIPKTESLGFMWVGLALILLCPICFLFLQFQFGAVVSAIGLSFGLLFGIIIFFTGYQQFRHSRNQIDIYDFGIAISRAGRTTAYEWSELKQGRFHKRLHRGIVLVCQIRLTLPDNSHVHFFHKATRGTNVERTEALDFVVDRIKKAGIRLQVGGPFGWKNRKDY